MAPNNDDDDGAPIFASGGVSLLLSPIFLTTALFITAIVPPCMAPFLDRCPHIYGKFQYLLLSLKNLIAILCASDFDGWQKIEGKLCSWFPNLRDKHLPWPLLLLLPCILSALTGFHFFSKDKKQLVGGHEGIKAKLLADFEKPFSWPEPLRHFFLFLVLLFFQP